jgi:hypothetical protein
VAWRATASLADTVILIVLQAGVEAVTFDIVGGVVSRQAPPLLV